MLRVYVAGPLSRGDQLTNVARAINVASDLVAMGFAPFVPHLYAFMHMQEARSYAEWMAIDDAFLEVCDAILRIPGESPGSDIEVAKAVTRGIPVFHTVGELGVWAHEHERGEF